MKSSKKRKKQKFGKLISYKKQHYIMAQLTKHLRRKTLNCETETQKKDAGPKRNSYCETFSRVNSSKFDKVALESLVNALEDMLTNNTRLNSTNVDFNQKCFNIGMKLILASMDSAGYLQNPKSKHKPTPRSHVNTVGNDSKMRVSELQKSINQLNVWIDQNKRLFNLQFANIRKEYPVSLDISRKQKEKLSETSRKHVRPTFQTKLQEETSIEGLESQLNNKQLNLSQTSNKLTEIQESIRLSARKARKIVSQLTKDGKAYVALQEVHTQSEKELNQLEQEVSQKMLIIKECDILLSKCSQFDTDTNKNLNEMEARRSNALKEFESKWYEWDYYDAVFWFKIKLGYFDVLEIKKYDINDNHEQDRKERENDTKVTSIDFDGKIYNNLQSRRLQGKFLSLLDKKDFRNLGFELVEHQSKLQKEIKKLVLQYPIPQDSDNDADKGQIEGLNVDDTCSDMSKHGCKYDAKYICPITKELMRSPVIAYDDCVYEKEAIIKYLRQHHTTPLLKNKLLKSKNDVEQRIKMLFPHYDLKQEIKNLYG